MRKLAYTIANLSMKLLHKNHRFRFIVFYYAQIVLSHLVVLFTLVATALLTGMYCEMTLFTGIAIFLRHHTPPYHAKSYAECGVISYVIIVLPALLGYLSHNAWAGVVIQFAMFGGMMFPAGQRVAERWAGSALFPWNRFCDKKKEKRRHNRTIH